MSNRTAEIAEINAVEMRLRDLMKKFLIANGWQLVHPNRWIKRFNGKKRDVGSIRLAFNIETGEAP